MVTTLNPTEIEIVSLFLRQPYQPHSVYSLSKRLNRYVSQVQTAITGLKNKKMISLEKLGARTSSCTINFSEADTDLLVLAAQYSKREFLDKNTKLKVIYNDIRDKLNPDLYIMLVFGSQAKGTATPSSDIDLCFIVQHEGEVEKLRARLKAALARFSYKIHIEIFTTAWFYDMLNKRESVGREILKSSVVLQGYDLYYNIVIKYDKEAGN